MADALDPKGLIRESYRIEGITSGECRSIFLDWALSVDGDGDVKLQLEGLIERYGTQYPDHPMTAVLREGLNSAAAPKRRGGWRRRER
ncbi:MULTISPECIES: hypothetical protein [unclassified Roseovarius]|uniref:hypothetical protein n=1 Tax=unclassified Roseovarius TaxID=2614913 RepID=UPI00273DDA91|nr:hypothetical protein [Roseovarius sp. MMSF_3350]